MSTPYTLRTAAALVGALLLASACGGDAGSLSGTFADAFGGPETPPPDAVVGPDARRPDVASDPESPFSVVALTPPTGSVYGDDLVTVTGRGFEDGVRVLFDTEEAHGVTVVAPGYLELRTPAHAPGVSDVRVEWPDGTVATLRDGFRFESTIRVRSIAPPAGSVEGGTPLTIEGDGFDEATLLVIGGRQALGVRTVDVRTLVALTPAGAAPGPVDVVVGGAGGSVRVGGGFTYVARTRIDTIAPAVGAVEGGGEVVLTGDGFAPDTEVYFGSARAEALEAPSTTQVRVRAPAGTAGAVDVVVLGSYGQATRPDGFVYVGSDAAEGPLALLGVSPARGPVAGGQRITVVAGGLRGRGPSAVGVELDGAAATVLAVRALEVDVTTPSGLPGAADVVLAVGGERVTLAKGYTYVPALEVLGVTPARGPVEGGTSLEVEGRGFVVGVDEVRVGALPATAVEVVDDGRLRAVVPPGAPGRVDVTVRRGDDRAVLPGGFEYTDPSLALRAVDPSDGSTSGGTRVHLYGAGLSGEVTVVFGTAAAAIVERFDDGHVVVRSPAQRSGVVDVTVRGNGRTVTLASAFTYFDPEQGGTGTWGAPIDGTVNVAVYDALAMTPVNDAFVVLGLDGGARYQGRTDAEGRITFSGDDLRGRQEISASHRVYSATSIIAFDATNVTLLLMPYTPPSSAGGGGGPPPNLAPGYISGTVVWDDKHRLLPFGNCGSYEPIGVLCAPCGADEDCGGEGVCTRIEQTGKFCTVACGGVDPLSGEARGCPEGFACAEMGKAEKQCVPAPPDVEVRCATTVAAAGDSTVAPGDGAIVSPDMTYRIRARLDELAVICVAQQKLDFLATPQPFLMGVRRHVQTATLTELPGQDVELNIPLRSTLRVRLDNPPRHPNGGDRWVVTSYLDFGAEGVFSIGGRETGGAGQDTYVLRGLPATLDGTLSGAAYLIATGNYDGLEGNGQYSQAQLRDLTSIDADSLLRFDGEVWQLEAVGAAIDIEALADDGSGTLYAAGAAGRIVRREGGAWQVEPTPTKSTLRALWVDGPDDILIVGDDGVVLRRAGRSWRTVTGLPGVDWAAVSGVPGGRAFLAGDRGTLVVLGADDLAEELALGTDRPLHAVLALAEDDVWVAGDAGLLRHVTAAGVATEDVGGTAALFALARTADGTLLALGEAGLALRREAGGWVAEDTGTDRTLRAAASLADGALVVAGDDGTLLRRAAGGGWTWAGRAGYRADLRAVVATDGAAFAAGLHNVLLSPLMGIAAFDGVDPLWADRGLDVSWRVVPSVDPTIQYLSILSNSGFPLWDVFLAGDATMAHLPRFQELAGFNPLEAETLYVTLTRIYHPSLRIDDFDIFDIWYGVWYGNDWPSWSVSTLVIRRS